MEATVLMAADPVAPLPAEVVFVAAAAKLALLDVAAAYVGYKEILMNAWNVDDAQEWVDLLEFHQVQSRER